MKREDFNSEEEYREFRRKANIRNKRYDSKPEVKKRKQKYKKAYDSRPEIIIQNKEYGKKKRSTEEYKLRYKLWVGKNRVHLREYNLLPENKIKKAISDKKYRLKRKKNPVLVALDIQRQRDFRKKNNDNVIVSRKKYYNSSKGKMNYRYHNQRRIALIKNLKSELSNENIKLIYDRDKVCVYCGSSERLEIDHIVPISNGGNSKMNNLVVSCKKCNCSKQCREVSYWCKISNLEVPLIVNRLLNNQKL